jgi:hypothetical protein
LQGRSALIFDGNDLGGYECLQRIDKISMSSSIPPITFEIHSAIDWVIKVSSRSSPPCLSRRCVRPILPLFNTTIELQSS